jgi:hypothetical protein
MTKDEALKMAIECLEYHHEHSEIWGHDVEGTILSCKEALEQPTFDYNTAFSHGYEAHKAKREYPTKEEMLNKIFEATYQQHSAKLMQPNEGSITFNNPNADWVLRITPSRKIEVNKDVEVTEAAQKVLDAIQPLLDKQTAQDFFERGKEIAKWADKQNEQPPPEVAPFDVWAGTNPKRTYADKDKVYLTINVMHKDKLIHLLRIQRNEDKKYYIELNDLIRFINMGNSKKEWQGLSDDEMASIWVQAYDEKDIRTVFRVAEQALKEKNT